MTDATCERITLADLTDLAAGDLPDAEAAVLEEHLFACAACGARAAEFEALVGAIGSVARASAIGGFVTESMLNRLARDGVRMRMFTLTPGAVVPCAVWDGDEMMALRLRGEFGDASEVTLTQSVAGTEVSRATARVTPGSGGDLIFAQPAAVIREFPAAHLDLRLIVPDDDGERTVGRYTLVHGGTFHRR